MIDRPFDRRMLAWILGAGFVLRLFVAMLTPVPAEDGANYLWMAQQFWRGDAAAALSEVFPPLWPLVAAPFVALGDAFRGGQLAAALVGTLSVWPAARIVERVAPGQGLALGWLLALAPLPVRFAAECYSEPLFLLVGASAVLAGLRGRFVVCGALAGVAFWVRPEGALIAVAFLAVRPRQAWKAVVTTGLFVLALALWRTELGQPFAWLPKLDFNAARGDAAWSSDGIHLDRAVANLLDVPALWFEAFVVPGLFAVAGLVVGRRQAATRALYVLLLLGIAVIILFLARRRFLVSWTFVVMPFAALGLAWLPTRARFPLWFLAMVTSLLLCFRVQEENRYSERIVGEYLGDQLEAGETVSGDMTRVIWFAGLRPLPPLHFTPRELADRAREPSVRFVVLGERRDSFLPTLELLGADFDSAALPDDVRRAAELRGIRVFERAE